VEQEVVVDADLLETVAMLEVVEQVLISQARNHQAQEHMAVELENNQMKQAVAVEVMVPQVAMLQEAQLRMVVTVVQV